MHECVFLDWKQTAAHLGFYVKKLAPASAATTHVSLTNHERQTKTVTEEKNMLNKVIIFVFFLHKKYSRSFKK